MVCVYCLCACLDTHTHTHTHTRLQWLKTDVTVEITELHRPIPLPQRDKCLWKLPRREAFAWPPLWQFWLNPALTGFDLVHLCDCPWPRFRVWGRGGLPSYHTERLLGSLQPLCFDISTFLMGAKCCAGIPVSVCLCSRLSPSCPGLCQHSCERQRVIKV